MNDNILDKNTESQDKPKIENVYTKFIDRYHSKPPHLELKAIAQALELSTHQLYRLRTSRSKILKHREEELDRLDHYLRHDGNIKDFKLYPQSESIDE